MEKEKLFGKTLSELGSAVLSLGMPAYTAKQLAFWLYGSEAFSFAEMSNLSIKNRELLSEKFDFGIEAPLKVQISKDETMKYLFRAQGGNFIEAAFIPDVKRNTLCLSTQVGCKMGCLFCMTGRQGFQANLSPGAILNQVRSLPERTKLTNIVYMGMGEPFDNTDNVMKSLEILTSAWGFGMSSRRITVSTIGLIPGMLAFLKGSQCNLAVSLHSPFDEERRRLMPVQHAYPIREVISALQKSEISRYRKLSFEYILFKGINDSSAHVNELARLLNRLSCRINLLHYHQLPGTELEGSDEATILRFQAALKNKGIMTTIRQSRGLDIDAACGLLSTQAMGKETGEKKRKPD